MNDEFTKYIVSYRFEAGEHFDRRVEHEFTETDESGPICVPQGRKARVETALGTACGDWL